MCVDPITASIGIAVGGKIIGAVGQAEAAKKNKREANRAAVADRRAVVARLAEEKLGLRQEETQSLEQLAAIKSRILTQAAEGNVSGVSLDLLSLDIERQRGEIQFGIAENIRTLRRQASRQLQGVEAARRSRISQVRGPNLLQLGVEIATGVNAGLRTKQGLAFENRELDTVTNQEVDS